MDILLDTQALIWALTNPSRFTIRANDALFTAERVYVSPISFYEIAIKITIGKNPGTDMSVNFLVNEAILAGFIWLPLSADHIKAYTHLPFFEQHRDPFDRMIIAIAMADNLTIISSDRHFSLYQNSVNVLW